MHAEITTRTLEFAVSGVSPIKYDYVYCDAIGVRVTYTGEEATSLTVLAIDQETKQLVPIAYRLDSQEMWEPWLRELVEEHQTLEGIVREKVAREIERRSYSIIAGEAPETEKALEVAAEIARTGDPYAG